MRVGTAHFVTKRRAISYYRDYEGDTTAAREAVYRKLSAGEIFIGPPKLKPGEKLVVIDEGRRYAVEDAA